MASQEVYYVPDGSKWPIIATLSLFTSFLGGAVWFNGGDIGKFILFIGLAAVAYMFHGWFKDVIKESLAGKVCNYLYENPKQKKDICVENVTG